MTSVPRITAHACSHGPRRKELPRLESLCDKMKLDDFEKIVLILIIGARRVLLTVWA